MRYVLCFVVLIGTLYFDVPVEAEVDFRTGVNRDTITVGDPVVFRMRISRHKDDRVWIQHDDAFPTPFELRETSPADIKTLDQNRVQETRDYTLTIYQVGDFSVPSVILHYATAGPDSGVIHSQPIPVVVRSVKPDGLTDIRDVKPPVSVQAKVPLWVWGALVGGLLLIAGAIWWWRRRLRKPKEIPPPPPVDWEQELAKIGYLGLLEKRDYKQYYSLLSEVMRRCIEAKMDVRAVEHTTFEIAGDLRALKADDMLVLDIERFLSEADRVKFAKYTPSEEIAKDAMPAVLTIVKRLVQPPVQIAAPSPKEEGV